MNNIKKNIKPTLVLGIICIVVALLLAGVNMITKPIIDAKASAAVKESLGIVMPDGEFNPEPDILPAGTPKTVTSKYTATNGKGYVVTLVTTKGYTGNEIAITAAIDTEGKLIKAVITKNEESITSAGNVNLTPDGSYLDIFKGATADSLSSVDTGATPLGYSRAAIKDALYDAFIAAGFAGPDLKPLPEDLVAATGRDEAWAKSKAEALSGESVTRADIATESDRLMRVYKTDSGKHVMYVAKRHDYNPTANELEAVFVADKNGKITKFELVTWTVGHGVEYTEAFVNSFVGKNSQGLADIGVVTGATSTSNNIRYSVIDALDTVYPDVIEEDPEHPLPEDLMAAASRDEAWALDKAKTLSGENVTKVDDIKTESDRLMRVYKTDSGKYVMYVAKRHDYVPTLNELEAFFVADRFGKITKFELVTWLVGHGVDYDEAFVSSFVGKDADMLADVDIVTGATGTSDNIRFAVIEALETVYTATPYTYIGWALLVSCIAAFVAYVIYSKRRMRNEK